MLGKKHRRVGRVVSKLCHSCVPRGGPEGARGARGGPPGTVGFVTFYHSSIDVCDDFHNYREVVISVPK